MTAELLVMCSECGRPQAAVSRSCAHCGGLLPDVSFAWRGAPSDVAGSDEATWHAELGRRRSLGLSRDRIGWRSGDARNGFALAQVSSVSLHQRPLFELLALSVAAVAATVIASALWLQVLLGGLATAAIFACFAWRSYALRVGLKDGKAVHVPLVTAGVGGPKSRMDRLWASLSSQLERHGVSTRSTRVEK